MSVLMVLQVPVTGDGMRRVAEEHGELLKEVAERGKAAGAIHHDFYAADDHCIVVDEWPDADSFHAFFDAQGNDIGQLMAAAGATGAPGEPQFYERLSLGDHF